MNKQELFDRGLLEAFVLNITSPEENALIEPFLADEDVQAEIKAIEEALFAVAESQAKPVPAGVYESITAELFGSNGVEEKPVAENKTTKEIPFTPVPKEERGSWKPYAIAASIIGAISMVVNFAQYQNNQKQSAYVASLEEKYQKMDSEFKVVNNEKTQLASAYDFFSGGDVHTFELGHTKEKKSCGMVYWDKTTGEVMVQGAKLPELPADKQFQVWGIVGGNPVDLGVIPKMENVEQMLAKVKNVKNLSMFCITIEPLGGRETPTLEQLIAVAPV